MKKLKYIGGRVFGDFYLKEGDEYDFFYDDEQYIYIIHPVYGNKLYLTNKELLCFEVVKWENLNSLEKES